MTDDPTMTSTGATGPVTRAENLLARIGPSAITFLCATQKAPDVARALADIAHLVTSDPRFSQSLSRHLNQYHWHTARPLDLARHISILQAPDARVEEIISALRRSRFAAGCPPWRAVIVNSGGGAVTGVAFHIDHVIADGLRLAQLFASAEGRQDPQDHSILTAPETLSLARLQAQADPRARLDDLAFVSLPRAQLKGTGGTVARLIHICQGLITDPELFAPRAGKSPFAMVARLAAHHTKGMANAATMVKVPIAPKAASAMRGMLPHTPRELEYEVILRVQRVLPDHVLRPLAHHSFTQADQVLTLVPARRRPGQLFGQVVTGIYATPPMIGRPPIALTATSHGKELLCSVIPGEGCKVPAALIADRLRVAL